MRSGGDTQSSFRAPSSRAEPRASVSRDARGEINNARRRHGLAASKFRDELGQNLTDQPGTIVLIGLNFDCLPDIGDFAVPFLFFPFHNREVANAR